MLYCKECGFKNREGSNYCSKDGADLQNIFQNMIVEKEEINHCKFCGHKAKTNDLYCSSCGMNLLKIVNGKNALVQTISNVKMIDSKILLSGAADIKKQFIGLIASLGALFIICFLLQTMISNAINELLRSSGDFFRYLDFHVFTIKDIVLILHSIEMRFKLDSSALQSYGAINIHLFFILLLLIPGLSLGIGGFVFAKLSPQISISERIRSSLFNGILYGLSIALIALLGKHTMSLPLPYAGGSMKISVQYAIFQSLFHGFIFGAFFYMLGTFIPLGLSKFKKYILEEMLYGVSIYEGISAMFKGIGGSVLVVAIYSLIEIRDNDILENLGVFILVVFQASVYLWNILNFNTFSIDMDILGNTENVKFSLIGGLKGSATGFINHQQEIYIYAAILIPILLLFYSGKKIKMFSRADYIKSLLAFSTTYATGIAFIAELTHFDIHLSGQIMNQDFVQLPDIQLGNSSIQVWIVSFIFSFAITYLLGLLQSSPTKNYVEER